MNGYPSPYAVEIVLDTRPLLELMEPLEPQLARIQLSPKILAEYVFSTWPSFDSTYLYLYNDGNPFTLLKRNVYHDILEASAFSRMAPQEQEAITKIVMNATSMLYVIGRHTFDQLNLHEHQLQTLTVKRWLGKALLIHIIL